MLPAPIFTPKLKPREEPIKTVRAKTSFATPTVTGKRLPSLGIGKKSVKINRENFALTKEQPVSESHSRSSSRASTGRSGSEVGDDVPGAAHAFSKVASKVSQSVRGVQRLPLGASVTSTSTTRSVTAQRAASIAQTPASSLSRSKSLQRPFTGRTETSLGKAAGLALQRLTASVATAPSAEKARGLRVPSSRVTTSGATPSQAPHALPTRLTSNLPKPTSKLPAPSRTFGFTSRPSVFFKKPS